MTNPASRSSYRVVIRGPGPGGNYCSCPDYATNELGTCKHIEFTLGKLKEKPGAKAAFARGYWPAFSEIYLRTDGRRRVHFRTGTDCPPAVAAAAARLFDLERDSELPNAAAASDGAAAGSGPTPEPPGVDHDVAPATPPAGAATAKNGSGADPWAALVQIGVQVITAFASAGRSDAPAHPWIERDPVTGGQSLKVPLPPPEIARQLADALSALADRLRAPTA